MNTKKRLTLNVMLLTLISPLIGFLFLTPASMEGQNGYNAVYTGGTCCLSSAAFVDASVYSGDLCFKIYQALQGLPIGTAESVIDARGINPGGSNSCTNTPWWNGSALQTRGSYILLPAGTITISSTWIMPDHAKLVGQGLGHGVTNVGTTLLAPLGFSGTYMVQMGSSTTGYCISSACVDVSIEGLALNGSDNGNLGGILNANSQEMSFVNRVSLKNLPGTALQVGDGSSFAQNSGPYSNIWVQVGTSNTSPNTHCAQILKVQTRGIHGMTCVAPPSVTVQGGVLLDAHNNIVENVHFEGFQDGVLIGSQQAATSNTLININGSDAAGTNTNIQRVVHISAANVTDLSIQGIEAQATGTNTFDSIQDDETGVTLNSSQDADVGLYVLGQAGPTVGSYTRFSTSPRVQSWAVGTQPPPTLCSPNGALYTNAGPMGTTVQTTMYVCVQGQWKGI